MTNYSSLGAIESCIDRANNRECKSRPNILYNKRATCVKLVYPTPEKLGPVHTADGLLL